jgi:hypothetical protein
MKNPAIHTDETPDPAELGTSSPAYRILSAIIQLNKQEIEPTFEELVDYEEKNLAFVKQYSLDNPTEKEKGLPYFLQEFTTSEQIIKRAIAELQLRGYIRPVTVIVNGRERPRTPHAYVCREDLIPKPEPPKRPAYFDDPFGSPWITPHDKGILAYIISRPWGPVSRFKEITRNCRVSYTTLKASLRNLYAKKCTQYVLIKSGGQEMWVIIATKDPERLPLHKIEERIDEYLPLWDEFLSAVEQKKYRGDDEEYDG